MPGMTATAKIIVEEKMFGMAVPMAALRFTLPAEEKRPMSRVFVERDGTLSAIPC